MSSPTVPTSCSLVLAPPLEVRGDERAELAVEHRLHVSGLGARAFVLHELIRRQGVRPDLTAERDIALLSRHLLHCLAALVALTGRKTGGEDLHCLGPVLQL